MMIPSRHLRWAFPHLRTLTMTSLSAVAAPAVAEAPRRILFAGDIHCGSAWGLWPEDDLPKSARWSGIRYLMQCWRHFVATIGEVDLLVLTGDLIDGSQRKSDGTGLLSTSLGDQTEAAISVLRPLAALAKKVVRVDGTPYHEGFQKALAALDKDLGVGLTKQVIDINLPGGVLNVAHHPGGGSALYEGTKLNRESILAKVAASDGDLVKPRWIARGHLHVYRKWDDPDMTVVLVPCWQLATPYAVKGNYWKWQPVIGAVEMLACPLEPSGYRIIPHTYPNPIMPTTNVEEIRARA